MILTKKNVLLVILLLSLMSVKSFSQQSNKKSWGEPFPFKNYPYLLYSIACSETSYSKDKEWKWNMKIHNTSNNTIEFDYFYMEVQNGKKMSSGRISLKAGQEKEVGMTHFTKKLQCGNVIYVGVEKLKIK